MAIRYVNVVVKDVRPVGVASLVAAKAVFGIYCFTNLDPIGPCWILNGVVAKMNDAEARYVRALGTRYNSWIARQVA